MIKKQLLVIENGQSICCALQKYMQDDSTDIYGVSTVADALDSFMKLGYSPLYGA